MGRRRRIPTWARLALRSDCFFVSLRAGRSPIVCLFRTKVRHLKCFFLEHSQLSIDVWLNSNSDSTPTTPHSQTPTNILHSRTRRTAHKHNTSKPTYTKQNYKKPPTYNHFFRSANGPVPLLLAAAPYQRQTEIPIAQSGQHHQNQNAISRPSRVAQHISASQLPLKVQLRVQRPLSQPPPPSTSPPTSPAQPTPTRTSPRRFQDFC